MPMTQDSRIYVAGHRGLVGSAIWRELRRSGFQNLLGRPRQELDLVNAEATRRFFESERPDYVLAVAARVGGIAANASQPAQFLYENLQIQNNLINSAWQF